jgi:4a-hydroxytetrahydrobiopterin dehydratase
MIERITPRRFHEADGVEDWRVVGEGACTYFRTGAPRPQRNRIHIDVWVPHDQAEARIAAAIAAGGHLVTGEYAPAWWVLADAEGNEVDVATWMGRD